MQFYSPPEKRYSEYQNQTSRMIIEFLVQVIVEAIFHGVLGFPGAVIRWMFSSRKKSIMQIYKDDIFINATVGGIFLGLVICAYIVFAY
jgi:hypothetical protein